MGRISENPFLWLWVFWGKLYGGNRSLVGGLGLMALGGTISLFYVLSWWVVVLLCMTGLLGVNFLFLCLLFHANMKALNQYKALLEIEKCKLSEKS